MLRTAGLVIALCLAMSGSAQAGTADAPEISDPCLRPTTLEVTPSWTDICSGWFEGGGAEPLTISLELAGGLYGRVQEYQVIYRSGGCRFRLVHEQGVQNGPTAAGPVVADSGTLDELRVGCGPSVTQPCGAGTCTIHPPERSVPLPAGSFSMTDFGVRWRLDFSGTLAEFAPFHAKAGVLKAPSAHTCPDTFPPQPCTLTFWGGDTVFRVGGDDAEGVDYKIPDEPDEAQ